MTRAASIMRIVVGAVAIAFVSTVATASILVFRNPSKVDFLSYWAAGRLALQGRASSAYDIAAHRAVELSVLPHMGLIPFPYPPPFLFAVSPFALFPMAWAFALWILVTGGLYVAAMRRTGSPALPLAHPSVVTNGLIGQNGFLTTAIFASGLRLLPRSPVLGGAILGLLSIKPQLAVLLPVALVAGREWRALAAMALSAAGLWLAALALFGPASYEGFLGMLPRYAAFVAAAKWPWSELASPFALFSFYGMRPGVALALHTAIAVGAAAAVCRLWWRGADSRAAGLVAAALLVPPYLFTYDALFLSVAFAWLMQRRLYAELAGAWLLCLLPVAGSFGFYSGPNTVPLAAILCLWTASRPRLAPARSNEVGARPEPIANFQSGAALT